MLSVLEELYTVVVIVLLILRWSKYTEAVKLLRDTRYNDCITEKRGMRKCFTSTRVRPYYTSMAQLLPQLYCKMVLTATLQLLHHCNWCWLEHCNCCINYCKLHGVDCNTATVALTTANFMELTGTLHQLLHATTAWYWLQHCIDCNTATVAILYGVDCNTATITSLQLVLTAALQLLHQLLQTGVDCNTATVASTTATGVDWNTASTILHQLLQTGVDCNTATVASTTACKLVWTGTLHQLYCKLVLIATLQPLHQLLVLTACATAAGFWLAFGLQYCNCSINYTANWCWLQHCNCCIN